MEYVYFPCSNSKRRDTTSVGRHTHATTVKFCDIIKKIDSNGNIGYVAHGTSTVSMYINVCISKMTLFVYIKDALEMKFKLHITGLR